MPHHFSPQPAVLAAPAGSVLAPGRALGMRPAKPVVLQIESGLLWVTLGEPDAGAPAVSGDRFLGPGDSLRISAGARVVMEPVATVHGAAPVHFQWNDAPAQSGHFVREVVAPARDVVSALAQAGTALTQVFKGLWGCGGRAVAQRSDSLPGLQATCRS